MEADLAAQIAAGDVEAPVAELDRRCGRRLQDQRLGLRAGRPRPVWQVFVRGSPTGHPPSGVRGAPSDQVAASHLARPVNV